MHSSISIIYISLPHLFFSPSCASSIVPPRPTHNNGPGRIPGAPNLILVLLQPNQPPTTPTRGQRGNHDGQDHADDAALPRPSPALTGAHNHAHAQTGAQDENHRLKNVVSPAAVADVPSKHGEQPKHLDAEQSQAKDLSGGGQAAGEHRGRHERGIGRQRRGELGADAARVVKEEDVDGEQPEGDGPDAVAAGRLGEGPEDRAEAQERGPDEQRRLDGAESLVRAVLVERHEGLAAAAAAEGLDARLGRQA